ncbi:ATPase [Salipiger aestuarii]|uniref:Type II secretory pathway predicted ATPase ExeA n=1 Tax=Salipiger aestuarii TaxID=568098 RepID=A0A327XSI3_9RHOB|nr:AAA family ATPase [Salipiger aestuarii]KAB2540720.1 ATPase [Salipiger aestuarii]RAK11680.1 type II secretory pathway predicted ATPase ExeA [Salipiger aestuarii]
MSDLQHYLQHFGLKTRPFSLAPDPGCIYWSPAHTRAWTMLEYGVITCAPVTLITGDVGAGKTTLLRHLIETSGPELTIGLVTNAHGSRGELLQWVLQALGLALGASEGYVTQFDRLQTFLIEEYAAGRRVLLIFDEAQNLGREALEELRMLTNINSGPDELLQLILAGQPELRDMVRRPDMTQFAQRVAAAAHLGAMSPGEVRAYIGHRSETAGGGAMLFDDAAIALIAEVSRGVPRLVNQLSEMALMYAFAADAATVARGSVQAILDDDAFFGGDHPPAPRLADPGADVMRLTSDKRVD